MSEVRDGSDVNHEGPSPDSSGGKGGGMASACVVRSGAPCPSDKSDAERYRWLVRNRYLDHWDSAGRVTIPAHKRAVDRAIDKEMRREK